MDDLSQAQYPIDLNLPQGDSGLLEEAARAILSEYRNSVRWKRLRSRKVSQAKSPQDDSLFIVDVGHTIEFDWSWEGAVAFRPIDVDKFDVDADTSDDFDLPGEITDGLADSGLWYGEVVEVDQVEGQLYINTAESDTAPTTGTFFVKPFEFLAYLNSIYHAPQFDRLRMHLPARLQASQGNIHPLRYDSVSVGLPEFENLWNHSWSVLWGPPGTGKTFSIGKQLAACSGDSTERILVVSTTNAATDEVAISIGQALGDRLNQTTILRVGKGASYGKYVAQRLESLLRGTETEALRDIEQLIHNLKAAKSSADRAFARKAIQELRRKMADSSFKIFVAPRVQIVVTTAFNAVRLLSNPQIADMIGKGHAPFTTVVVDEAGLLSRATVAALSLFAAKRTLLVGDPKQLAPISKVSRLLPTVQAKWLANSALTYLDNTAVNTATAVYVLKHQHRMHPDISRVVSNYQYRGQLVDADEVLARKTELPALLRNTPRAIWYALDDDAESLTSIRAQRGPGNRSWVRPATRAVLKKFFSNEEMLNTQGLFLSPYAAQARDISQYLQSRGLKNWSAGTVHSQQGVGVDIVVFDTVNAGSCGWPAEEWKRIINVGLSRAKHFAMLLASRAEMDEPFLRPLLDVLTPYVLVKSRRSVIFAPVDSRLGSLTVRALPEQQSIPELMGNQLEMRKALRPLLSKQQQQLIGIKMDGKPRLVRGVAGSGKTIVLANWLKQVAADLAAEPDARIWAVYANAALQKMIRTFIAEAWTVDSAEPFPWERVETIHIRDVLNQVSCELGFGSMPSDEFDYNQRAVLLQKSKAYVNLKTRCRAMFIDEAQDMGPDTLRVLTRLVEQSDKNDPNSRAVHIFYDNAQNIYGRGTPKWVELGLDMRGRSTVMEESFRSTRPIAEFALNVLYRLQPPDSDPDYKELIDRDLVEAISLPTTKWWKVRFNQVDGPLPKLIKCITVDSQMRKIASQIEEWIFQEHIKPQDIVILCNQREQCQHIQTEVGRLLRRRVGLTFQAGYQLEREPGRILITTPHSFKGYDSELVIVANVEGFISYNRIHASSQILANNLYVAMTRARSILELYVTPLSDPAVMHLINTIASCRDILADRSQLEHGVSKVDDLTDLVAMIGNKHEEWLRGLIKKVDIIQEPLLSDEGEILAEPAFWFKKDDRIMVCLVEPVSTYQTRRLKDLGIQLIKPGELSERIG